MLHRPLLAALFALLPTLLLADAQGGPLDSRFGPSAGHYRYDRAPQTEISTDLAIDSQGRILVAFLFEDPGSPGTYWPALIRLTPAGFTDPSFGLLGLWVETVIPAVPQATVAVAVDGSDRPLVGWTYEFDQVGIPNRDWAVRRLTTSGTPDLFKVGAFDLGIGGSGDRFDELADLLVWWDGRVIAVGDAQYSGNDWDFAAIVWMPNLADGLVLDPTFDGDGRATVHFDLGGYKTDRVESIVAHGTGFVIAGWAATAAGGTEFALCRFELLTGGLDTSFGSGGKATYAYLPLGGFPWKHQFAYGVAVVGGDLVVAGSVRDDGSNRRLALLRLDDTGQVDPTWGALGWHVADLKYPGYPFDSTWSGATDVVADGSDRILAVGQIAHPTLPSQSRSVAVRLTAQGTLDPSFSVDGAETYGLEPAGQPNQDDFYRVELVDGGRFAVAMGSMRGITASVARSDFDLAVARIIVDPTIFADGFESGTLSAWAP